MLQCGELGNQQCPSLIHVIYKKQNQFLIQRYSECADATGSSAAHPLLEISFTYPNKVINRLIIEHNADNRVTCFQVILPPPS
jgi:hypothetical protein